MSVGASTDFSKDNKLYRLSIEEQKERIERLVDVFLGKQEAPREKSRLDADLLDRKEGDRRHTQAASGLDLKKKTLGAVGAVMGACQARQRLRRDALIVLAGRKRMLLGAMESMYRRGLFLKKRQEDIDG